MLENVIVSIPPIEKDAVRNVMEEESSINTYTPYEHKLKRDHIPMNGTNDWVEYGLKTIELGGLKPKFLAGAPYCKEWSMPLKPNNVNIQVHSPGVSEANALEAKILQDEILCSTDGAIKI